MIDYEKYHKKGGSYVIPVEIFDDLLKEYNDLKADYGSKSQVERDMLLDENKDLKRQLKYLRSEEYFNQLRFERDMLQDLVQKGEVSKEDKLFIDMTHRNTELLEESRKLKEKYNRALKQLIEYAMPCEIDNFNTRDEYCSKNCGVDEETYLKCWNRFIEQELEKSDK